MRKEIETIKERNRIVELDKSWETSKTRKLIIAIMTYIIIVIFLLLIKNSRPWLNALVPTLGFILSTSILPLFKRNWIKYTYKK